MLAWQGVRIDLVDFDCGRWHAGLRMKGVYEKDPKRGSIVVGRDLPMPQGLGGAAQERWQWLVDVLERAGRLHEQDAVLLEELVRAYELREQATNDLAESNGGKEYLVDEEGVPTKRHPSSIVRREATDVIIKLSSELGISAKARVRIAGVTSVRQTDAAGNPFLDLEAESNGTAPQPSIND